MVIWYLPKDYDHSLLDTFKKTALLKHAGHIDKEHTQQNKYRKRCVLTMI